MEQLSVRRLLNRRVISGYLARFAQTLPDVLVALLDIGCRGVS